MIYCGIPSIAGCLCITSTILHVYSFILHINYAPFIYIVDCTAFLSVTSLIYSYYYSFAHRKDKGLLQILYLVLCIAGASVYVGIRSIDMCAQGITHHTGIISATVIETENTRYATTAILDCTWHNQRYKAYCICNNHYQLNENDVIILKTTAYPTRNDDGTVKNSYLAKKGISAIIYFDTKSIIEHQHAPTSFRRQLQQSILHWYATALDSHASSLLTALYLGNKSYIHPHIQLTFKEAGVMHVLAASGLHVGIIVFSLLLLCKQLSIPKRIAIVIAAFCVAIYFYISNQPASLLRASLMYVVASFAIYQDMQHNSINILMLSACIILCLYPFELFNPGFQLSFFATFGILLCYNTYHRALRHFGKFSIPLAITFSAQLFTVPICAFHFNELSLMGFISNCVIIPVVSAYMIAGLLLPIAYIFGIQSILSFLLNNLYFLIDTLVTFFASFHGMMYADIFGITAIYFFFCIPLIYRKPANTIVLAVIFIALLWYTKPATHFFYHYKSNSSSYVVNSKKETAFCVANINTYHDYTKLVRMLKKTGITKLHILIPYSTMKNMRYIAMLARQYILLDIIVLDFTYNSIKQIATITGIDAIPLYLGKHPEHSKRIWDSLLSNLSNSNK